MKIPCQFLQQFGAMRANHRAVVEVEADALDLIRIHLVVPMEPGLSTQLILADDHLEELQKELNRVVAARRRQARRSKMQVA